MPVVPWTVGIATDTRDLDAYRALRRDVFVAEQGLFTGTDADDIDDDPRTVVLVARAMDGVVLGGVRLAPATEPDLGWWIGGRLVVRPDARRSTGVGAALVRAACAHAERLGVLRFEASVQMIHEPLFTRLGWHRLHDLTVAGQPHARMRWPINRYAAQARSTKAALGPLLAGLHLGGPGFVGTTACPCPAAT